MVKPITKYCVQIRDAQNIRYELEKACSIARSGRPGPVLVDIPDDLQRTEIDPETLGGYTAFDAVADLTPSAMQLQQLTQLLDRAERPVLILGWGIRLAGGCDQAISLAEKWGIPVLTSWAAKDMIDAAHSLCVGTFGTHGTHRKLHRAKCRFGYFDRCAIVDTRNRFSALQLGPRREKSDH